MWVKEGAILSKLYAGRIIIPQQVYSELLHPGVSHLKTRLDALIVSGDATIQPILMDTPAFTKYHKLAYKPDDGYRIIGKGEAAAIALASDSHGTVASNNLMDVLLYKSEMGFHHMTTGDILIDALNASLITESRGNEIWNAMLEKKRKIGPASFTDYLQSRDNNTI